MFLTVAYTQTYSAAQTDVDFPALADPSVTIFNNHVLPPVPVKLMWAYVNGLLAQRMRIRTSRLANVSRPLIRPIEQAASPSSRPQFAEYFRQPLSLNANEEIQLLYTTTTAVAERSFAILTMGDGNRQAIQGDYYTVRCTTSFTTTANVWSSGSLTYDDTLQTAWYAVVGLQVVQATIEAARLIFPGAPIQGAPPQIRPGVIGDVTLGSEGTRYFRWGNMGEYGRFFSLASPNIEVLNSAAVANPEVYLDLCQVHLGP